MDAGNTCAIFGCAIVTLGESRSQTNDETEILRFGRWIANFGITIVQFFPWFLGAMSIPLTIIGTLMGYYLSLSAYVALIETLNINAWPGLFKWPVVSCLWILLIIGLPSIPLALYDTTKLIRGDRSLSEDDKTIMIGVWTGILVSLILVLWIG